MPTKFTDGSVTVTLDSGLDDFVRKALDIAERETVRILEEAAEEVAAKARADWYAEGTGVTRKTGKSGDIQVTTTFDSAKGEVRVSVASTDTSKVGSKPRAALIHRPGRLSLVEKLVSRDEWWGAKKAGRPVGKPGVGEADWTIFVANPKASDGKYLVPELIRKPMRVKVKAITPDLGRAIASKVGR